MGRGRGLRRGLLLDRDGVINHDLGYVASIERFAFQEGIFGLTRRAADCGYVVAVMTNQSGIARGYYSEADFLRLSSWMVDAFARQGVGIAGIFYCPFLPGAAAQPYDRDSFWRKPNPGMILEAARTLDLDLTRSIFLGDQASDMASAKAAGVGLRVLFNSPERPGSVGTADLAIDRLEALTARLSP